MTENTTRPGLWPIPGEGVLARQGDLILLTSTADDELTDGLLALLEKTADTGGDGRQLADAVADLLAGHASGPPAWIRPARRWWHSARLGRAWPSPSAAPPTRRSAPPRVRSGWCPGHPGYSCGAC